MTDRRKKINELKASLKEERACLMEVMTAPTIVTTDVEIIKKMTSKHKLELSMLKENIKTMDDELTITRMNKNGSKFFEWHPHKGFNRRQAKAFRKSNTKVPK